MKINIFPSVIPAQAGIQNGVENAGFRPAPE